MTGQDAEAFVFHDNRKVDPETGEARAPDEPGEAHGPKGRPRAEGAPCGAQSAPP